MTQTAARETVSLKLSVLGDAEKTWLLQGFADPEADDALLDGLHLHLDKTAAAPFLNALKLERCGEWLGGNAPARLQIRLMEAARSSRHPAYEAFRAGLARSGGLDRAFPQAPV